MTDLAAAPTSGPSSPPADPEEARVAAAIDELLAPMRERRAALEGEAGDRRVLEILRAHTARANAVAEETLTMAKQSMKLDYGRRELLFR